MTQSQPWYYLPSPTPWPVIGSTALFLMTSGAAMWFNGVSVGPWTVLPVTALAGVLAGSMWVAGWAAKGL